VVPRAVSMGRLIPAKTKVWGSSNQYDIHINPRRMEHFVSVVRGVNQELPRKRD
jgi:hypothetical protein